MEVNVEMQRESHTEYVVYPDGLVKSTQFRILGRALTNLAYDPEFNDREGIDNLRKTLAEFFG